MFDFLKKKVGSRLGLDIGTSTLKMVEISQEADGRHLKNYAFLKKQVVIAGLYNRVEIWDEDKWQEYQKKTEMEVGDMAERLKELGI